MNDFDFNFDLPTIDILEMGDDVPPIDSGRDNRYLRARKVKPLHRCRIKYDNALKLAKECVIDTNIRYTCLVSGNFVFGDFLEAFIVHNNAKCKKLTISTLSLDQNNVDSLENLLNGGFVDELNLIISDYFYAHERRSLIPYIYQNLDIDNKFQLASAGVHTKIAMFETLGGKKIVIHGSANMRSSGNIEQFVIEECEELYDAWITDHQHILEKYKHINKDLKSNKSVRGQELWDSITK